MKHISQFYFEVFPKSYAYLILELVPCDDFFYFTTWGVVGTGGGAVAPHTALSTEIEEGEAATAEALYGVTRPLLGNLGHMVSVHG